MRVKPQFGQLLYHTTIIENVPSILEKGILSRKKLISTKSSFNDIADDEILEGRKHCSVDLSNYVPFHFFSRTPFEIGLVQRYGMENLAIISIYRPNRNKQNSYKIIPCHPLARESPKIMSYQDGFNAIKWDILNDFASPNDYTKYDFDIASNRTATMAECLVPEKVEPSDIAYIYVNSKYTYNQLLKELETKHHSTKKLWGKISVNIGMFPEIQDDEDEDEDEEDYDDKYDEYYYD